FFSSRRTHTRSKRDWSSDVCSSDLKEKLFDYIRKFGFGRKTGIDLAGEGTGILFKPEQVGPVELATTSFGQGVSVTPIQQVMAVAAAVNGGHLYEPHLAS